MSVLSLSLATRAPVSVEKLSSPDVSVKAIPVMLASCGVAFVTVVVVLSVDDVVSVEPVLDPLAALSLLSRTASSTLSS